MKYKMKTIILVLLTAILLTATFTKVEYVNAAQKKYVKSVTVTKKVNVNVGSKKVLKVKVSVVNKASKKVVVKVKNKKIAKVTYNEKKNQIIVKGVKAGNTKITLTTKGKNKKGKKFIKIYW